MSELEDQREDEIEDGLGEVPEDVGRRERIDYLKDYEGRPPPHGVINARGGEVIPPDIATENRIREQTGPLESPPIPASVTTVWDARPINARDFLRTGTDFVSIEQDIPSPGPGFIPRKIQAEFSYEIPQGYVGVLRGFAFEPERTYVIPGSTEFGLPNYEWEGYTITLLRDNIIIPDYQDMALGQRVEYFLPTFVIGTEGSQFTIRLTIADDFLDTVVFLNQFLFTLYGNNLLTRGLPDQFEIATQNMTGRENTTKT